MATTPEAKVKKSIRDILAKEDVYYTQPMTGGYGRSGQLDFVCSVPPHGRYLGVEAKSIHTKYGVTGVTALQQREIDSICRSGATAIVINEDNLELLRETIRCLKTK